MIRHLISTIALVSILGIVGCATSKAIRGPDGKMGFSISCPRSIENCYEKAAEQCPTGYNVHNSQDESSIVHNASSNQVIHAKKFNMFISCK